MIKLCVFDLDGTLVNSIFDISCSVNHSLEEMSLPTHTIEEYKNYVGNGMRKLCERALPDAEKHRASELLKLYGDYYIKHCYEKTIPYDGIINMLKSLKENNIRTAVLSNKPHEQSLLVVKNVLDDHLFDFVLGQTKEYPVKPSPKSLLSIIEKFGVSIEETVYIGDSDVDIILSKNVGCKAIGVSWGFRGKEELLSAGAEIVVSSADEISKIIFELNNL